MALSLIEEVRSTRSALISLVHQIARSAIILHLADRCDASEIASTLGIDRQRIRRCVRRLPEVGPL
jgi:predicted transcriptional regulator